MSAVDSKTDVPCDSIFIVDREQMMCELLQYRFESEGYIVDVAHDGYTALQRNLSAYSLILCLYRHSVHPGRQVQYRNISCTYYHIKRTGFRRRYCQRT